ncbi:hypothetical protein niasHT_003448 [Heterodera trifolii]|uniref:Uncharacterized protein n=1 Tax=Heterodera trifolii TaxID=157864 RepID=A0ABD2M1X6_9BILA
MDVLNDTFGLALLEPPPIYAQPEHVQVPVINDVHLKKESNTQLFFPIGPVNSFRSLHPSSPPHLSSSQNIIIPQLLI